MSFGLHSSKGIGGRKDETAVDKECWQRNGYEKLKGIEMKVGLFVWVKMMLMMI